MGNPFKSKPSAPAPEPEKVQQADVKEARTRAKNRAIIGNRSASLLTGGYSGYGQKDTLG